MRNFISTPNISLKRILKTRFEVYNVDEYLTSKLNYKTYEENENLYLKINKNKTNKGGKLMKMHSILTYKMVNGRQGCINRDSNGVRNIREIAKTYLITRERKEEFKRKKQSSTNEQVLVICGPKNK